MSDTIKSKPKTYEEVKTGLKVCAENWELCEGCPFRDSEDNKCVSLLCSAALELIEELEDKHYNECAQIMHYSDELRGAVEKRTPKKSK